MKEHTGMRPHDIVVLSAVLLQKSDNWYMKDLAHSLRLSQSEISESLHRSMQVNLIGPEKKHVQRMNLRDFIQFGLQYVFPALPGTIDRGIPAAISVPPFKEQISSSMDIVWAYPGGETSGITIPPLYPKLPQACLEWQELYQFVSILDVIRMNQNRREMDIATQLLKSQLDV
ncbi:hypothetical protein [Rhodohalobacter sp. 614A]|uniref:hypothetical protein n=1 Tax=Rhodohalobacter sp. 614A TaxID=2908649 RepID=UPI001F257806|nr:hypothetical protein [Rhodohalobacter sp. 614A]